MPIFRSIGIASPKSMRVDGSAIHIFDRATAQTTSDVLEFAVPAGLEIMRLDVRSTAGTMTFSVGVRPARADSAIVANPTLFAAAGQAFTNGNRIIPVAAVKYDEDVVLTITTAVAAGTVDLVIDGNAVGAR